MENKPFFNNIVRIGAEVVSNIYVDETCHLERDKFPIMCIGYIKIDRNQYIELSDKLKNIKLKHRNPTEIKWNKVSYSRLPLYKELIDFFFDNNIEFRCLRIVDKSLIDNDTFNDGDHDVFYYKAAFYLLKFNLNQGINRVYFDIKDDYGKGRLLKLSSIFDRVCRGRFIHFQHIRSHENQFIQLTDLFIGAIAYSLRDDIKKESKVKNEIIDYIEKKSQTELSHSTPPWEIKFNIFDFRLHNSN